MGFSIVSGSGWGLLGLVLVLGSVAFMLVFLLAGAKQAHDQIVEDEGDDPDIIA